jgi:heterodisulfide reductase subunit A
VQADPITLETGLKGIFAGGDLVTGPGTMIDSMAHGRKAAISIQESWMTGLHLFLENKGNISHLVENGINGSTYEKNSFFPELVKFVRTFSEWDEVVKSERRQVNLKANQKFSYDSIVTDIL